MFLLFSFIFLFICEQQNINESETVIGDKKLSVQPYGVSNHVRKITWWHLVRIPWYPGQEPISRVSRMNEQVYEWSPKKIKVRQKKHELCCGDIITKEKLRKSASTIPLYLLTISLFLSLNIWLAISLCLLSFLFLLFPLQFQEFLFSNSLD